jgi:hypothetical protein
VRQELITPKSLDSGFRLVLRSTASRGLPADPPTSGGEVAARVQGVGQPMRSGKVHRGGVPRAQISRMAILQRELTRHNVTQIHHPDADVESGAGFRLPRLGVMMCGSGTSCPPATVVSVPIASLGFRTDIMLLALGGSSITEHDGLTVVATPRTPDFWWGNFVLVPDASALDALGIDAAAAGRGLTVERDPGLPVRGLRRDRNAGPAAAQAARPRLAA